MRELTATEIFGIGGAAGLNFTSPITGAVINNVADATTVGKMATLAFGAGYAFGTWLNQKFDLSTKIVDLITG